MKLITTICLVLLSSLSFAQTKILLTNVQIFNGKDEKTMLGNVLVEGNLITKISTSPIPTDKSGLTKIIDAQGKFLMPGLIDDHWHTYMCANTQVDMMMGDFNYTQLKAGVEAGKTLLRGFTTIRDLGGPVFGLKRAVDEKLIPGPRIYPSGAMISQTSGHGDFRTIHEKPQSMGGEFTFGERMGVATVADGVDQVLAATRDNLRLGASQIKVHAGGGAASAFDPLDVTQYTSEELKAAVDAAADWGTYVTVHVYGDKGIRRALDAGVKVIDHGLLMTEETMKYIAQKDAWLSMQPLAKETAPGASEDTKRKKAQVAESADNAYKLAKKYKVKLAWGSDLLFQPAKNTDQSGFVVKMADWFTPFEVLKMVTYDNAQLLLLSGERNPYKAGKLGVIEEGAYADFLLIDGNPLKDLSLIGDPEKNFKLIVKDGIIYKNSLQSK
jgi:imidazolonepropionase-like amidohydrolase